MSIGSTYATVSQYRADKKKNDTRQDSEIERSLLSWSRLLEADLGTFFNKDAAAVDRLYVGNGSRCLRLNEIHQQPDGCPGIADVTGFTLKVDTDGDGSFSDETAFPATDYQFWPLNYALGPQPMPIDRIVIPSWSVDNGAFPSGQLVQVHAIFGWPSVPDAVKDLVLELTAIWRLESARAAARLNELDSAVAASPMAMSLLKKIRELYGRAVYV